MSSWQSQIHNISDLMQHVMQTKKLADVTFRVGQEPNQKIITAHKFLIASRSDVFEKMFYESSCPATEIPLTDIKPDIFEIMLKYIYTEKLVVNTFDEAIQTCRLAAKYNVVQLVALCKTNIEKQLCQNNVCLALELAIALNDKDFIHICEDIISKYSQEVFESETFLSSPIDVVKSIMMQTAMNIPNELYLFEVGLKWAKTNIIRSQNNSSPEAMRTLMNPLLPCIRFLSMKHEDIFKSPATSGVLNSEEIMKIGMTISGSEGVSLPTWCNHEKNPRKRLSVTTPEAIKKIIKTDDMSSLISSYSIIELHHNCLGDSDRISSLDINEIFSIECMISFDADAILFGFSFCVRYNSVCNAELYMAQGKDVCRPIKCLGNVNESFNSSKQIYNHRMVIADPIKMKRNEWYYAKVCTEDPVDICIRSVPVINTVNTPDVTFNIRYINIKNDSHFHQVYYK
ncbi:BTB/POZ domain-containing protein 2-like [Centruroides vittatus]|uniref:BTB/POZ domain-containing protein 2-like n=1 Tax=Centruroides vittatus TaxID=120091 RepID=UPI00350FE891